MKTNLILSFATLLCTAAIADDHVIKQEDREFSTTEITIKPGDTLVFTNCDAVTHNVFSKSDANPFTIKVQKPGEASSVEFKDEGVTEVRCAIHPKMKITVTVKK
jgi:plastocyanin